MLQYYKPVGGAGTWIVRGYDRETRKISQARLGEADDFTPADGTRTLTYAQARAKAEKWILDRAPVPVKKDEFQPALRTVRDVVANYIETARMERKKAATAEADRKALEGGRFFPLSAALFVSRLDHLYGMLVTASASSTCRYPLGDVARHRLAEGLNHRRKPVPRGSFS